MNGPDEIICYSRCVKNEKPQVNEMLGKINGRFGRKIATLYKGKKTGEDLMLFHDRQDAGRQLAEKLNQKDVKNAVVLALPRGGVTLGIEIARKHQLDFDVLLSKKIGHPYQSEYAIGVISENGDPMLKRMEADQIEDQCLEREVKVLRKQMMNRGKCM